MLEHYLDSFLNDDSKSNATLQLVNDHKFFGIGLNFEQYMNLQAQSFGVNILSAILSNDPYYIWLYFQSILTI